MTDGINLPPLLESLIQAAYDDGQHKREEFSERLKAARASVVTYVQRLSTAPHPAISGYTCTVPDGCETLHWRGQILSMNELASVAQPTAVDEAVVERATTAYLQSRGTYEGEVPVDRDDIRAALTAALTAQQPAAVDGRGKGMEEITKKTTTITETTRLELTEEQIASALLKHFGMVGGTVSFDVSSGGFLRGAQIELTRVSGGTE